MKKETFETAKQLEADINYLQKIVDRFYPVVDYIDIHLERKPDGSNPGAKDSFVLPVNTTHQYTIGKHIGGKVREAFVILGETLTAQVKSVVERELDQLKKQFNELKD